MKKVEVGSKFSMLTVVDRVGTKVSPNGCKKALWKCLCECGNYTEVTTQPLTQGSTKSCGCLKTGERTDLTGLRQGFMLVSSKAERTERSTGGYTYWYNCLCDCGRKFKLRSSAIKNGSISCGCKRKKSSGNSGGQPKHGHTVSGHSPTYTTWHSMMQRCLNENHETYEGYGKQGIVVCDKWKKFEGFLEDMGERPEGMSLNRIHGANIYSKETCEWATSSMQAYDQKKRITNKSGKTGVCWDKRLSKWEAYISVNKKKVSLGYSEDLEEAN